MIEIETKDLEIGMFVAHLDRPWLETSFMFQGFRIENDNQIEQLRRFCKMVKIDEEQSAQTLSFAAFKSSVKKDGNHVTLEHDHHAEHNVKNRFAEELAMASDAYENATVSLNKVLNNFRLNNYIAMPEIKSCVQDVVSSVMRNPNTLVLLGNLRSNRKDTVAHSINTCVFSSLFGRYLRLSHEQLTKLSIAALLHDVGEAKVPKAILDKCNKGLTNEEQILMEQHPQLGAEMLAKIPEITADVVEAAYSHHEKIDGTGYPRGLKGSEISLLSKILAIVDSYEKISNGADPKTQISCSDALKSIYALRDTAFDAELVEGFIKCLGIYPVGSIVQLNNGSTGVVIGVKSDKHLLPTVMVIRDNTGEIRQPPQIINLDRFRDQEGKPLLLINKVIQPNAVDIDLCEYIVKELGVKVATASKLI